RVCVYGVRTRGPAAGLARRSVPVYYTYKVGSAWRLCQCAACTRGLLLVGEVGARRIPDQEKRATEPRRVTRHAAKSACRLNRRGARNAATVGGALIFVGHGGQTLKDTGLHVRVALRDVDDHVVLIDREAGVRHRLLDRRIGLVGDPFALLRRRRLELLAVV